MRSVSRKRDTAPRAARRARRPDLAARLKVRARALKSRVDRRDALIEAVREANGTRDSRKVGEWLVRQAQGWIPAPCWVVIAHDLNGHLNVLADAGLVPNLGPSLWSSANWVMRHGSELFSGDLARDPRSSSPGASGSVIAFPLLCRNRSVGVLVGLDPIPSSATPSMSASLVIALRELLEPSAIALDNGAGPREGRRALGDRRSHPAVELAATCIAFCGREAKRAVRNGRPLSLLFLDLDTFKQVNDQHGHLAGSKVLVEAASVIKKCSRETDMVARFGGDEFSLILPDTGTDGAMNVAERILVAMREARFLTAEGLSVRQTVSIGVATLLPESPKTAEELMKLADMAMYRVKAAGKDGIHFAQEGP